MKYHLLSMEIAINFIKTKRPSTFHSIVFEKALNSFNSRLKENTN